MGGPKVVPKMTNKEATAVVEQALELKQSTTLKQVVDGPAPDKVITLKTKDKEIKKKLIQQALPAFGYNLNDVNKGYKLDNSTATFFLYSNRTGAQVATNSIAAADQAAKDAARANAAKQVNLANQKAAKAQVKKPAAQPVVKEEPTQQPVAEKQIPVQSAGDMESVTSQLAQIRAANPALAKLSESQNQTIKFVLKQLSDYPDELNIFTNALKNKTGLPKINMFLSGEDIENMTDIFAVNGCLFNFKPTTAGDPIFPLINNINNMDGSKGFQKHRNGTVSTISYREAYTLLSSTNSDERFEAALNMKNWITTMKHAVNVEKAASEEKPVTTGQPSSAVTKLATQTTGTIVGESSSSSVFVGSTTYQLDGYAFGKIPSGKWSDAVKSIKNAVVDGDQTRLSSVTLLPKTSNKKNTTHTEVLVDGKPAANVFALEKNNEITFVLYSDKGIASVASELGLNFDQIKSTAEKGGPERRLIQLKALSDLVNRQKTTEIILNKPDIPEWERKGFKISNNLLSRTWTVTPPILTPKEFSIANAPEALVTPSISVEASTGTSALAPPSERNIQTEITFTKPVKVGTLNFNQKDKDGQYKVQKLIEGQEVTYIANMKTRKDSVLEAINNATGKSYDYVAGYPKLEKGITYTLKLEARAKMETKPTAGKGSTPTSVITMTSAEINGIKTDYATQMQKSKNKTQTRTLISNGLNKLKRNKQITELQYKELDSYVKALV